MPPLGAAPNQGPEPGSADADLQRTETASAARPGEPEGAHLDQRGILGGRTCCFPHTGLSTSGEAAAVRLLADLPSKLEERGLMATVPGELLFTEGSDEVQVTAYDTLAKVAELIGMHGNRQVLIIGHSDAKGDAAAQQAAVGAPGRAGEADPRRKFRRRGRPAVHAGHGRGAPDRPQRYLARATRQPSRGSPDPELSWRRATGPRLNLQTAIDFPLARVIVAKDRDAPVRAASGVCPSSRRQAGLWLDLGDDAQAGCPMGPLGEREGRMERSHRSERRVKD